MWDKLKKPLFLQAPMADVTDIAFRELFAKYGKPDVFWTEFVSADGLASEGKQALMKDLEYEEDQRPIVAQLFTSNEENMEKAAMLCKELGFDGIDINMGCPDRAIEKQGCGANMIKNKETALKVIEAARKAGLPVSVKTRLGYGKIEYDWIKFLLEQKLPALIVHLRTRQEMSKVDAHWECMKDVVALRDEISPNTLIIGNGDVYTVKKSKEKIEETGCDGVMIGRGVFGNPWVFAGKEDVTVEEKLKVLIEHTDLFEKKVKKNFNIMKKHFKAYVNGFDGAKELRVELMENSKTTKDVEGIIKRFLNNVE